MIPISVRLDQLFTERPLAEAMIAASVAGFQAVELASPYDAPAQDLSYQLVMRGLGWSALEAPPPNYTGGEPGWAASPDLAERFARDLKRALRFADVLKAPHLVLAAGPDRGADSHGCFIANLRMACAAAPKRRFLIAPDDPELEGAFLASDAQALEVIAEVGMPNLFLSADLTRAEAELGLEAALAQLVPHAGCLRLTQRPEKAALEDLLARLDAAGFTGYLSIGYRPAGPTEESLDWFTPPAPAPAGKPAKTTGKAAPKTTRKAPGAAASARPRAPRRKKAE